jgi:hypothetical protein
VLAVVVDKYDPTAVCHAMSTWMNILCHAALLALQTDLLAIVAALSTLLSS